MGYKRYAVWRKTENYMSGTPTQIVDDVRRVLQAIGRGNYDRPYLTAYQIFQALPDGLRARLILEYGQSGKGAGQYYSAASAVATAAEILKNRNEVEISMLATVGLEINTDHGRIEAGNPNVGLYRLRD